jgi:aminobenzoyl-glutamate utilization protein B
MKETSVQTGLGWIDQNTPRLVALSRDIWGYAEIAFRETRSANAQAEFLKQEGFAVQIGVADMPSALVASFGEGKPIIGFLGEYDALIGMSQKVATVHDPVVEGAPGHGCGHNLLGVGSLASAVALKNEMAASGVAGTVRYYGCPAEENGSGKGFMARAGIFDDLDAAITWHPSNLNAATYRGSLAVNAVRFAFHGRSAHAGGAPHLGISALDAVELMNVGVNFLREHIIQDARIHYVISKGGDQPNVVPSFAEVWYYVRAPRRQDLQEIYERVIKIAEGAALMTGARLEVKFEDGCYEYLANPVVTDVMDKSLHTVGPPVFSDEEMAFARDIAQTFAPGHKESMLRANHVPRQYWDYIVHTGIADAFDRGQIGHGSTDVGDVSWVCPTGQLTTATYVLGTSGHSWQAAAASGMGIGEKGMITAARAMALAGYELMTQPELVRQAREAFIKDTDGQPYVSPLPPEMKPPVA